MIAPSSGNMRDVAAVLERFLCPGGKLRLSPYVEAAQCAVLLGERPDPKRHVPSLAEIVARPEHKAQFDSIAQLLLEGSGIRFGDTFFAHREFLDLYLAHYFPANVGKLQLVLLDLLRIGQFPEELHLVDLGVGTGTSFVAVLDFVLALGAVADVAGVALPLRALSLRGYDRSPTCLAYAKEVATAWGRVLADCGDNVAGAAAAGPALTAARALVEQALADVRLRQGDIGGVGCFEFAPASLVVLSYVLNDLHEQGRVEAFEARLAGLGSGSQVIVLEPGQQKATTQLMRWRRSLVRRMPHLQPLLPCGQEFGTHLPSPCDCCWCARREELHGSSLQRAYLGRLDEYLADCAPETKRQVRRNFERLSWSYCVLSVCASDGQGQPTPLPPADPQRYIGQRRNDPAGQLSVVGEEGTTGPRRERRLLALCPARAGSNADACGSAVLVQDPGKVLPPLHFGELIALENVAIHRKAGETLFTLNRTSHVRPAVTDAALPGLIAQPASLNALARQLFGFAELHDFQHTIIGRILEGRNTLGLAATASGKTECFLLPALLLPGLTVVVSPLKSLMQDQWERCDERYGLGALTTYVNGDVEYGERIRRLRGMREGRYKLAYFTPEQLARYHVRAALQRCAVSVLAVDEAHCVSQWGHDFRPDYLNMVRRLRTAWDKPPVIVALTATASERVRRDLCSPSLFDLDNRPAEAGGDVVYHGSNRLEIDLVVRVEPDPASRGRRILEDLQPFARDSGSGSALVFLPYTEADNHRGQTEGDSSPAVEPFAAFLERHLGRRVATYHGQMGEGQQTEVGTFLRARWRREDNDWGVYIFQGTEGTFCGVGRLRGALRGVQYTMVGCWKEFEKYGRQFLFNRCTAGGAATVADRPLGDVSGRDRRAEQRAFMHSENRIMVATKSFGMGIDKADIRLVIHHSPPGDLLSYAQELGRAARDGGRGLAILSFTEAPYPGGTGARLTDERIQERFIEGRYVRESDLRACIAFLRQCPRRLEVSETGGGRRTCVIFSFEEMEAYWSYLGINPTLAGLPRPYEWPAYKERSKVVQLTLEVLFKTVVPAADRASTLLESCQEVSPCLHGSVGVDWEGLEDSNADLLREVLDRQRIGRQEFESLCREAEATDLLPLARRLRYSVEDTVAFLLEASHLRVIRNLRLGTWGAGLAGKSWEVCLSPILLSDSGLDALITSVVSEHQRRRDEDCRDWELMLTEYVGIGKGGSAVRRCLRRVLLAFLHTGEDVADEGCGACSGCCPDGDFLPLAERAGRIIAIPPELWSRLEAIRKATDSLPDIETLRDICAFLGREDGVRWRRAVSLNAERMRREDSGSVGAMALLLCFAAHGWLERAEEDLPRLFEALWRRRSALGAGLARLAELVAAARPGPVCACWRARAVHAHDAAAGLRYWRALLQLEGVPREFVHEAASALAAGGEVTYALLAARTGTTAEQACAAYETQRQLDLRSAAVLLDEGVAVLDAAGSERARAETFVGLLLAACRRGAAEQDVADILDAGWSRIEHILADVFLTRLLQALAGPLTVDGRWRVRFIRLLGEEKTVLLRGALLGWCGRFLEHGGRFAEDDMDRIAAALSGVSSVPRALLVYVWGWAIERQRADVVRGLLALHLSREDAAFRQRLVEGLLSRLLRERRTVPQKVAEAVEVLLALQQTSPLPQDAAVQRLAERADRCPVYAAAYVAWLEYDCGRSRETVGRRVVLFQAYARFGLLKKAVELAKAFPGIKTVLQVEPGRYLASHPRAAVARAHLAWDDILVNDFRRFLRQVERPFPSPPD